MNIACHAGIKKGPLSDPERERFFLDAFYCAALGEKWPLKWQWDLGSKPEKRCGVLLDAELRVVTLQLDFGKEEGETWFTEEMTLSSSPRPT